MNFEETLQYMMSRLPMYQKVGGFAFKKSLDNIIALCDALDNPQEKFKSIHIAGTNGKGSTAHMLAAVFQTTGYKTGLYTSPHLKSFTERIRINGQEIEKQSVIDFIEQSKFIIEELSPSFFEITVAMAFQYFAMQKVDIAIIETGLGGRLDSTNILKKPICCLITNISYDHTDMLGETLSEIAGEKAGIIKKDVPIVISKNQPEIEYVFKEKAKEMTSPLYFAEDFIEIEESENLSIKKNGIQWLQNIQLGLLGEHQTENLKGVLKVIDIVNEGAVFNIKKYHLIEGLKKITTITGLKGRWQQLEEKPQVFCDVLHNEAGIEILLHQLSKYQFKNLIVVWGMVADKKHEKILSMLPKSAYYIFCKPNVPRGMGAQELQKKASFFDLKGEVIEEVLEAYQRALSLAEEDDFIFAGGSTFVVAELPI